MPQTSTSTAPVVKAAILAAFSVGVLNVLGAFLGFKGITITIAIAVSVPAVVAFWYAKVLKRAPVASERSRFLWVYSGIVAAFLALALLLAAPLKLSAPGAFILVAYYLPYPAFAQLMLSDKIFDGFR